MEHSDQSESSGSMLRNRLLIGRIVALLVVLLVSLAGLPSVGWAADVPAEATDEADHEEQGLLGLRTELAFWSLVVFIVFVLVLKKFAWGPLSDGLNKREARIRQDITDAEAARVKAERMLAEHAQKLDKVQDEVKEILAEARRDADHTKQDIVSTAQREAETLRQRAVTDIERARDQALKELFDGMAGQVADATEYVLGRGLNAGDQDRLITEALGQFPDRSN